MLAAAAAYLRCPRAIAVAASAKAGTAVSLNRVYRLYRLIVIFDISAVSVVAPNDATDNASGNDQ